MQDYHRTKRGVGSGPLGGLTSQGPYMGALIEAAERFHEGDPAPIFTAQELIDIRRAGGLEAWKARQKNERSKPWVKACTCCGAPPTRSMDDGAWDVNKYAGTCWRCVQAAMLEAPVIPRRTLRRPERLDLRPYPADVPYHEHQEALL